MTRRWDKLTQRHGETIPLLDLPTLPTYIHQELDMFSLAGSQEVIEELRLEDLPDEELGVSSIFKHTSALEQYRQNAKVIPDDIVSALEYNGEHPLIYVLLKYNEKYYWPVYDIKRKRVLIWPDVTLLNRIQCQPETQPAGVDPNLIEKWSDQCIRTWCDKYHYNVDQVVRICTLYLHPQGKATSFEGWIGEYLEGYQQ